MKPRVLHVCADGFGGGSIVIGDLAVAAREKGYAVDVMTADPAFTDYLLARGVGVVPYGGIQRNINPVRDLASIARVKTYLKANRYHLVHTHTSKGGAIGRAAGWTSHTPVVLHTVHGFAFHEQSGQKARLAVSAVERQLARLCHRIVTVSHFHRAWAVELDIARPEKLVAIPNGISPDRVATSLSERAARDSVRVDSEAFVVLATGRLSTQKGFEYLIDAIHMLDDRPNLICLIVGDGPLRHQLEARAMGGPNAKAIRFLGFRDDIAALLRASDLVVLPSLWEGLSISLLEAMAAGKPIVTTQLGSSVEVTEEGQCALLVPPKDPMALARSIDRLSLQAGEAEYLGRRALERFRSRYSLEVMVGSYMSLYSNPLGYGLTSADSGW